MAPVLMYHGLHAHSGSAGRFDPVYSVTPERFARQLDWLRDNGFAGVSLADADAARATGRALAVISFDDGDVSNIEVALPLLLERGMTAEFFITSDFIDMPGMLTATDVRQLAQAGMGIGSHGRTHAFLEDLAPEPMRAELRDSQATLSRSIGRRITSIALPGGRGGERERRAALALGYRHLLGSVPGPNRQWRTDAWLQRLAVTRNTKMEDFAALVRWQGVAPRIAKARFLVLGVPKRVLGNRRYQRLRESLL